MTFLSSDENLWLYVPLIMWLVGILYLSSSKGAFARTLPYFVSLLSFTFPRANKEKLESYYRTVRKISHFLAYAILALLASIAFYNSSLLSLAKFWYLYSFAIVIVVAALDEGRQSLYEDRVGSLSDVALDCLGGLSMITVFWFIAK